MIPQKCKGQEYARFFMPRITVKSPVLIYWIKIDHVQL